jgi:hypothetical protein
MTLEDLDLPYDYADNTRAGTLTFVAICVVLSLGMIAVHLIGWYALPWAVMLAPAGLVAVRALLFTTIRNGVHEALRDNAMDTRLDNYVDAVREHQAKRTLTAASFRERLIGEVEEEA